MPQSHTHSYSALYTVLLLSLTSSGIRDKFRFCILPRDTWTHWLEELGIKPPTLWLVDKPMSPLCQSSQPQISSSHLCLTIYREGSVHLENEPLNHKLKLNHYCFWRNLCFSPSLKSLPPPGSLRVVTWSLKSDVRKDVTVRHTRYRTCDMS